MSYHVLQYQDMYEKHIKHRRFDDLIGIMDVSAVNLEFVETRESPSGLLVFAYVCATHLSRWWFQISVIFTPNVGEMIQFD